MPPALQVLKLTQVGEESMREGELVATCKIEFESNTENLCVDGVETWRSNADFTRNFCGNNNQCALRWCYVRTDCVDKEPTDLFFTSLLKNAQKTCLQFFASLKFFKKHKFNLFAILK